MADLSTLTIHGPRWIEMPSGFAVERRSATKIVADGGWAPALLASPMITRQAISLTAHRVREAIRTLRHAAAGARDGGRWNERAAKSWRAEVAYARKLHSDAIRAALAGG